MKKISKEIRDCREHADQCARKAKLALSRESRDDFLRLQKNWLDLARSYELAEEILA
jgi:hypothetical protein